MTDFRKKDERLKMNVEHFPWNDDISMPKANEINLIDSFKSKFHNWVIGSSLHNVFQANIQGPKMSWGPKFF